MNNMSREYMMVLQELFDTYATKDQKNYYLASLEKYSKAAEQVNAVRAWLGLAAGLASGFTTLIAALPGDDSPILKVALILIAVMAPAIAAGFHTLSDLFQWDRLSKIYNDTLDNLEYADALSPRPSIPQADLDRYRGELDAFVEGTLIVMRDEATQWGQPERSLPQLEEFLKKARDRSARLGKAEGGNPEK